jgi:hypothetical protein
LGLTAANPGLSRDALDPQKAKVKRVKTLIRFPVVLALFALLLVLPSFADEGDPPNRVARLSYMQNAVSFEPSGENDWSQATLNYPLTSGDRLWTDNGARAELETGNVAMRMSQQTDLTATNLSDQLIQLGLAQGSLRIRVYELRPDHSVEIDTPNAAFTILRAGDYRIDAYPDQNMTVVTVNDGELQATGNGINQMIAGGQALQITGSDPVEANWVAVPGPDNFDQWSNERDQKYLRAQARQYVSPEVPGYYDLDGYGSWASVPEYGPIWYPSGVAAGWTPYRNGRWVWVEPWGWTWVEDAPWGFAPFHYGRWVQVGPRWGWLPGPIAVAPVYGPAFVAFVGGPGFSTAFGAGGVAAWFPLGPGEPFYPWYHHSDVYLRQINVTNVRNINVTNITNVNNIHYRYQNVATTAVSANAFRNSEPVMRNIVRVTPQQLQRAQVIPHPQINPTARSIVAGTNPEHPPVAARRPAIVQHPPVANIRAVTPAPAPRNAPLARPAEVTRPNQTANESPRPAASGARTPPPAERPPNEPPARTTVQPPPRENPPAEVNNRPVPNEPVNRPAATPPPPRENPPTAAYNRPTPAPQANRPVAAGPPPNRPPLVAKTPPPTERMPYEQRAPAMAEHPGRPLEPQQRSNLSAGKPAGPMMDREVPAHAGPVRPEPQAQPHSAPPSHGAPPKH